MPHHRLTTNRALRTTGAAAGALALLALPLAAPAVALTQAPEGAESTVDADADEGVDDLAARVLEIAERAAGEATGSDDEAAVLPAPDGEREMEPAGSNYEPVAEPAPAPSPAGQTAAASSAPPPPTESSTIAHDANGPVVPGWFSRTATAYEPVQAVAGPMTVPAPQFASAESLSALAGAARDGWTAVAAPISSGLNPHTPTQWPIAIAAGMLLLVGGAHTLRVYDKRWNASFVTTTE